MDLLLYVVALVVLSVVFWWSLRSLHRAGLPSTIDGMRVEATAAVVAEDRVLEVLWEVPVIVSNTSRRPRQVPLISDQAHVWAGRAKYLCGVSSETDWQADDGRVLVLNPGATVTASVWAQLPAGEVPRRLELHQMRPRVREIRGPIPAPDTGVHAPSL